MSKLGVVVPFRNRWEHYEIFKPRIQEYLTGRGYDYSLIIVEQDNASAFNRGKLCNIGYLEAKKEGCDYTVFHDVDMIPVDVNYSNSDTPVHLASDDLPFDNYFGGITLFPNSIFEKINGFSNQYWGWGFEDDELRYRCIENNIPFASVIDNNDGYTFKTAIFNGVNAYGTLPNTLNTLRDFTIEVEVRLGEFKYDHEKDSDVFPILSLNGYDFSINYTSFKRFEIQFFDTRKSFYNLYSEVVNRNSNMIKVQYSKQNKAMSFYLNGKLIGERIMDFGLINYKKVENIYIGTNEKKTGFFNGSIDTLSIKNQYEEHTHKFHGSRIENYSLKNLIDDGDNLKLYNVSLNKFNPPPSVDNFIPFRRQSKLEKLNHENNGFTGDRWASDLTRWNQLRFNNEVLIGHQNSKEDGLNNCEYKLHNREKSGRLVHLKVGI